MKGLIRIADGHGGKTQTHAFVEHADIMIQGVVGGGLDLELFASTACDQ